MGQVLPQQQEIYPFYTGRMFLAYMGLLKGVEKKMLNDEIEKYASKVNLLDVLDRKVGTYSGIKRIDLLLLWHITDQPLIFPF